MMNRNDFTDIEWVCPECKSMDNLHPFYSDIPWNASLECLCSWKGTKRELKKKIIYYKLPVVERVEYL